MTDYKVISGLAFILAVNMLFFLGQTAITKINPDGPVFFSNDNNYSMIGKYNNNYTLDENVFNELPNNQLAVNPESDAPEGYFTDIWQSIRSWFSDTAIGSGVTYLLNIVNAFPHFLSAIGTPKEISFALGFFWHAITIFLIVMFLKGGS